MAFVYKQKHVEDGSIDFHAVAGIPAFRVQRVKELNKKNIISMNILIATQYHKYFCLMFRFKQEAYHFLCL